MKLHSSKWSTKENPEEGMLKPTAGINNSWLITNNQESICKSWVDLKKTPD